MPTHPFHNDNRAAWNVTAAKYEESEAEDIAFLRAGGSSLLPPEQDVLRDLGQWCQRAVHLQCAAGLDSLSLLHHGAQEVVGIDISERMIASARRKSLALSAAAPCPATWYCCDVLAAPSELDGTADLVHTGRGALPWLMDLEAWASVVYRLLKPGGKLHIFEGHPLDWVWDWQASSFQFHPLHPGYFSSQPGGGEVWPRPFIDRQPDLDPSAYPLHDRQWTLGQTINTVIAAGLRVTFFQEYPHTFWNAFENIPEPVLHRLPHTFTLVAVK
jgi:SAM-dependent methyltransferase